MVSGLYKYIVFDAVPRSTGKVYDEPCHRIMGANGSLTGYAGGLARKRALLELES